MARAVIDHRRAIKHPLTEHAAKQLASKFGATPDPNAAADLMIERGWLGFKPEWMERDTVARDGGGGMSSAFKRKLEEAQAELNRERGDNPERKTP